MPEQAPSAERPSEEQSDERLDRLVRPTSVFAVHEMPIQLGSSILSGFHR